ncbi:MAG: 50S ribosomal protein L18 [Candidatus Schekmanbacteria bacterium]|nr:50S ribosomal protein L18 [Candidatus Schekmanbacteria bacterium]
MPDTSVARVARERRHQRVRKKVSGTPERPRLSVFKSLRHIYAQVIDDSTGRTIASASTHCEEIRPQHKGSANVDVARLVGKLIAERAREKGVTTVVFDRGGYVYHGKIKQLADAAREGKLEF